MRKSFILEVCFLSIVYQTLVTNCDVCHPESINISDNDWVVSDDKMYLVHVGQKTHLEAQKFCVNQGGKLFEPKSEKENVAVASLAKKNAVKRFWIGIHDKSTEGKFEYELNSAAITYSNWNENHPENVNTSANLGCELCVEMLDTGKWQDIVNCLSIGGIVEPLDIRSFVCERDYLDGTYYTLSRPSGM